MSDASDGKNDSSILESMTDISSLLIMSEADDALLTSPSAEGPSGTTSAGSEVAGGIMWKPAYCPPDPGCPVQLRQDMSDKNPMPEKRTVKLPANSRRLPYFLLVSDVLVDCDVTRNPSGFNYEQQRERRVLRVDFQSHIFKILFVVLCGLIRLISLG